MGRRHADPAETPAELTVDTALAAVLSGPSGILPRLVREQLAVVLGRLAVTLHDGSADGDAPEVLDAGMQLFSALSRYLRSSGEFSAQEPPAPEPDPIGESSFSEPVEVPPLNRLRGLIDELVADGFAGDHLGQPLLTEDAGELWEWLHLQSLGLPRAAAQMVRRRAAQLLDNPVDEQLIIPACPAVGHQGWNREPEIWHELCGVLSDATVHRYRPMIDLVNTLLSVLTRSADLATGHSGYVSERVQRLASPEQRAVYRQRALRFVRKLEVPDQGHRPAFKWLVTCDELVRSVFPLPLPAPDSWWSELSARSATVLRSFADDYGETVQFPELGRSIDDEQVAALLDQDVGRVLLRAPAEHARRVLWLLRAGHVAGADVVSGARVLVGED